MSLRLQRVRELGKRELGEIIRRELPVSEAGLINVNEVVISSDLHSATVLLGALGNAAQREQASKLLQKNRKRIQGLVAKSV
ncbi:MAG: ribosome-binding factor A, partial [Limisphaerales bacterium]